MPTLTELVIKISGDPSLFTNATAEVRRQYRQLDRDIATASQRMSGTMVGLGRQMTWGLTMPIVGVGVAVVKMAADFSQSMAKISGLANVSRTQAQAWKKDVLELASAYGKAPKEIADALYFISSSGVQASKALTTLNVAAKASAAGLGDTVKIADALTSLMNAFGKENVTAAQAGDMLVAMVREGKAEADSFAKAIGKAASTASEMGVSMNDVGAATAALTNVGLSAEESITGLRRILSNMLHPTKEAVTALSKVHLTMAQLRKEAQENLIGALLHLKTAFKGNVEDVAKVFGSVRGLNALLSLTGKQANEVQAIFNKLRNNSGSLDSAFNEMSNTLGFKLQQTFAKLKVAAIQWGDALVPIMEQLMHRISSLVNWFTALSAPQKTAVANFLMIAAVAGPLVIIFGELGRTCKLIYDGYKLLVAGQVMLGTAMGIGATNALSLVKVLRMLWTLMFVNPWLIAIGGAVTLAAVIWGVKKAADAYIVTAEELAQKRYDEHATDLKLNSAKLNMQNQVVRLVERYEELKNVTNKTTDQKKEMLRIMEKINSFSPDLIKQYKGQAGGLDLVADAFSRANTRAKEFLATFISSKIAVAKDELEKANKRKTNAKAYLSSAPRLKQMDIENERDWDYRTSPRGPGKPIFSNKAVLKNTEDLIKAEEEIDRQNKIIAEANKMLHPVLGPATPTSKNKSAAGGAYKTDPSYLSGGKKSGGSGVSKAEKDGIKLLEDYADKMNDLRKSIAMAGQTTEVAAVKWELYNGALSRTAKDGTKLNEQQKQRMIKLAAEKDQTDKVTKANESYKNMMQDLEKQKMIGNSTDYLVIAAAERKYGIYKDLNEEQYQNILNMLKAKDIDERIAQGIEDTNKKLREQAEAYAAVDKEMGDYLLNLRQQTEELGVNSEVDKVMKMFEKGGKFFGHENMTVPFYGFSIDFKKALIDQAKLLDSGKLSQASKDEVKSMQEQIALTALKTNYEKELYNTTVGKYAALSEADKQARLNAAKSLDNKEAEINAEKYYNEALEKTRDKLREIRMQITGMSKQDRVADILRDSNKGGKTLLTQDQAKMLADEEDRAIKLQEKLGTIQKLADGITKIFDDMVQDLWKNGFKNFFNTVINGFRAMLREMALEYLKSQIKASLTKLLGQVFGMIGGGGGGKNTGDANLVRLGAFAKGGRFNANRMMLVGEQGPELVLPREAGTVVNNADLVRAILSGRDGTADNETSTQNNSSNSVGGDSIVINITGTDSPQDWRNNKTYIINEIVRQLDGARTRRGRAY